MEVGEVTVGDGARTVVRPSWRPQDVPEGFEIVEYPPSRDGWVPVGLRPRFGGALHDGYSVTITEDKPREKGEETTDPEVSAYLRELPAWKDLNNSGKIEWVEGEPVTESLGEYRHRTWQTKTLCDMPQRVLIPKDAREAMWPGALIQGGRVADGEIDQCGLDHLRSDIQVIVKVPGAPAKIITPSGPSAQAAFGEALGLSDGDETSAVGDEEEGKEEEGNAEQQEKVLADMQAPVLYFDYKSRECSSSEAALLKLGITGKYLAVSASAETSEERTSSKTTIYAVLWHESFSYECETITPETCFKPEATKDQISRVLTETNVPLYVSSVTYGRYAVIKFEAEASSTNAEAALNLGVKGASTSLSVEAKKSLESILTQSKISVLAVGGPERNIADLIKQQKVSSYFGDLRVRDCVPIAYTLRTLNGNEVVEIPRKVTFDDYTTTEDTVIKLTEQKVELAGAALPWVPLRPFPDEVINFHASTKNLTVSRRLAADTGTVEKTMEIKLGDFRTKDSVELKCQADGVITWSRFSCIAKKLSPQTLPWDL